MWAGLTETGKSSSVTRPRAGGSWLAFEARGISQTRHGNQIDGPRGRPWDRKRQGSCFGCWLPTKSSRPPGSLKNTGEGAKLHQKVGETRPHSQLLLTSAQAYLRGPQCGGVNTVLRLNCMLWNWCPKEATLGECCAHEDASDKSKKQSSAVGVGLQSQELWKPPGAWQGHNHC